MSEKYSDKDKAVIAMLVKRMFIKAERMGTTYRRLAPLVGAKSPTTVWRWRHGRSTPSRHHVYSIKRFLGYSLA